MARKSRKYVIEKSNSGMFKVGGYIRLSVSKEEQPNTSIESQRLIIEDYIKNDTDLILHKLYIDENVSGSTFKRNGFEDMIEDIESGEVNCVVVKDLSRFSREFIGAGYYIEKYFPLHGVRFISISENFDTLNDIYYSDKFGNLKHNFQLTLLMNVYLKIFQPKQVQN